MSAVAQPETADMSEWLWYCAFLILGGFLYFFSTVFPAETPFWLPWEFSWPAYLAIVLASFWFLRGLFALPRAARPPAWRVASFALGMIIIYATLQTHVDYYAQHMFFMHRFAQLALHHVGPFLIGLCVVGPVIRAGMPDFLKSLIDNALVKRTLDVLQHPAVAPVLFAGLFYFWLTPAIHTVAMLDRNVYDIMNWSMVLDGILFWSMVLDSRPKPPARLGFLMRGLMILLIELPQMVLGAILSLSRTDYYPVYKVCGRLLSVPALSDQHYGGLIIWLPGTMMSFAAMIVVLVTMRINEEKAEHAQNNP